MGCLRQRSCSYRKWKNREGSGHICRLKLFLTWLPSIRKLMSTAYSGAQPLLLLSYCMPTPPATILFDGVCNLCSGFVQFVIARDSGQHFRFASLQSEVGRALLAERGLNPAITPETVVLLEGGQAYAYSTAVLRILRRLDGGWRLLYAARVLPRFLRDAAYRFVARHRYQWFGQQQACLLPTPALRQRFL